MEIQADKSDQGAMVVLVSGRMDAVTAPAFLGRFDEWIGQEERIFVVELSGLEYISSAGLRSILSAAKKLKAVDGRLVFCGVRGMVKDVFDISSFDAMFPIYEDVDQALRQL